MQVRLFGDLVLELGSVAVQLLLGCVNHPFEISQLLLSPAVGSSLECFNTIGHGVHDLVRMGDGWVCNAFVLELDRVRQSLTAGCLDMTRMGAVMFR